MSSGLRGTLQGRRNKYLDAAAQRLKERNVKEHAPDLEIEETKDALHELLNNHPIVVAALEKVALEGTSSVNNEVHVVETKRVVDSSPVEPAPSTSTTSSTPVESTSVQKHEVTRLDDVEAQGKGVPDARNDQDRNSCGRNNSNVRSVSRPFIRWISSFINIKSAAPPLGSGSGEDVVRKGGKFYRHFTTDGHESEPSDQSGVNGFQRNSEAKKDEEYEDEFNPVSPGTVIRAEMDSSQSEEEDAEEEDRRGMYNCNVMNVNICVDDSMINFCKRFINNDTTEVFDDSTKSDVATDVSSEKMNIWLPETRTVRVASITDKKTYENEEELKELFQPITAKASKELLDKYLMNMEPASIDQYIGMKDVLNQELTPHHDHYSETWATVNAEHSWSPEWRMVSVADKTDKYVYDFSEHNLEKLFEESVDFDECMRSLHVEGGFLGRIFNKSKPIDTEGNYWVGPHYVQGRELYEGAVEELETRWHISSYCRKLDRCIEDDCVSDRAVLEEEQNHIAHEKHEEQGIIWNPEVKETRVSCEIDMKASEIKRMFGSDDVGHQNIDEIAHEGRIVNYGEIDELESLLEAHLGGHNINDFFIKEEDLTWRNSRPLDDEDDVYTDDSSCVRWDPEIREKSLFDFNGNLHQSFSENFKNYWNQGKASDLKLDLRHQMKWFKAVKVVILYFYRICKEEHEIDEMLRTQKRLQQNQSENVLRKSLAIESLDNSNILEVAEEKSIFSSSSPSPSKDPWHTRTASSNADFTTNDLKEYTCVNRILRDLAYFISYEDAVMTLQGLLGAIVQIPYVILFLIGWIYLYGVGGMMFFQKNDPYHYSSVEMAVVTLMKVVTFETWAENFYVNYYGCDVYPMMNPQIYTNRIYEVSNFTGGIMLCETPEAQPVLSCIYYVTFIAIGAFGILATMIGIISYSMEEALYNRRVHSEQKTLKDGDMEELAHDWINSMNNTKYHSRHTLESFEILSRCLQGKTLISRKDIFVQRCDATSTCRRAYLQLSSQCCRLVRHTFYHAVIASTVILCIISTYMETMHPEYQEVETINSFIFYVFLCDVILVMTAEPYPIAYFYDSWKSFDFLIVVSSLIPGTGNLMFLLRILRVFRVVKIFKQFPRLQIIVESLVSSLSPIFFVSFCLFIWMVILAVIGMTLFRRNDPMHFADLGLSFITVFQVMTLDGWTQLLYINTFGCEVLGYDETDDYQQKCTESSQSFVVAPVYFLFVVITLHWVLVNMFIGVMMVSADEAMRKITFKLHVERQISHLRGQHHQRLVEHRPISWTDIANLRKVFDSLDFHGRDVIGPLELNFGLKRAGMELTVHEYSNVWNTAYKENFSCVNFYEFLLIVLELRKPARSKLLKERNLRRNKDLSLDDALQTTNLEKTLSELGIEGIHPPVTANTYIRDAFHLEETTDVVSDSEPSVVQGVVSIDVSKSSSSNRGKIRINSPFHGRGKSPRLVHHSDVSSMIHLPKIESIEEYRHERYIDTLGIDILGSSDDPGGAMDSHEMAFFHRHEMLNTPAGAHMGLNRFESDAVSYGVFGAFNGVSNTKSHDQQDCFDLEAFNEGFDYFAWMNPNIDNSVGVVGTFHDADKAEILDQQTCLDAEAFNEGFDYFAWMSPNVEREENHEVKERRSSGMDGFDDDAAVELEPDDKESDENPEASVRDMCDEMIAQNGGDNVYEDDQVACKIFDSSHREEYTENKDIEDKAGEMANRSTHGNTGRIEEYGWLDWLFRTNANNHLTIDTSTVQEGNATSGHYNSVSDEYIKAPRQLSMEKIGGVMFSPPPPSPFRGSKEYNEEEREIYREVTHSSWSRSPLDYRHERTFKSTPKHEHSLSNHQSYHHGVL